MKKTIYILALIYNTNLLAAGFNFNPKKGIFDTAISIIFADLKIASDGKKYSCLVDTGARNTIFKESILKDFPKISETTGGGISNTSQVVDLVSLDLELGDWLSDKTIVARTEKLPFDCLIGNNFFINRAFQIDFNKNQISDLVEPLTLEQSLPLNVYKNELGGHFGFNIQIGNKNVESIFDTGATNTVVSLQFVSKNLEHFRLIKEINVTDGNNNSLKAGLYEINELSFGDINLKKKQVYVLDLSNLQSKIPGVEVVLGLDVIQNFNWKFDNLNSRYQYLNRK